MSAQVNVAFSFPWLEEKNKNADRPPFPVPLTTERPSLDLQRPFAAPARAVGKAQIPYGNLYADFAAF